VTPALALAGAGSQHDRKEHHPMTLLADAPAEVDDDLVRRMLPGS
jgi:hypothetical protein